MLNYQGDLQTFACRSWTQDGVVLTIQQSPFRLARSLLMTMTTTTTMMMGVVHLSLRGPCTGLSCRPRNKIFRRIRWLYSLCWTSDYSTATYCCICMQREWPIHPSSHSLGNPRYSTSLCRCNSQQSLVGCLLLELAIAFLQKH